MLLWWIGIALIFQHLQCRNQLGAGIAGLDHFVDITGGGGHIGICKLLNILGDQFLAPFFWVLSPLYPFLEWNISPALRTLHPDLRLGAGNVTITRQLLAIQ